MLRSRLAPMTYCPEITGDLSNGFEKNMATDELYDAWNDVSVIMNKTIEAILRTKAESPLWHRGKTYSPAW
jgi:hypothetical protein